MKVRIHTYQVQRVTYEVDVENEAGAEAAVRLWFEEGQTLGFPISEEMDDEVRPYVLIEPLLESGDVDYASSRWLILDGV